jgi:hypothetical protein
LKLFLVRGRNSEGAIHAKKGQNIFRNVLRNTKMNLLRAIENRSVECSHPVTALS